jgi:RNA polymerase-binding transcription factor DksA
MNRSKRLMRHRILSRLYEHLHENYDFDWTEDAFVNGTMSLGQLDAVLAFKSDPHLDELRRALERLENGTFGSCIACKGSIAWDLLEVDPTQRFCARCEEQFSHIVIQRYSPFSIGVG